MMATERRLIDANALQEYIEDNVADKDWLVSQFNADWIYSMLESAPFFDAVEVVRCKDCRYYDKDALWCDISSPIFHPEHYNWYEEDFCSYGERK